VVPIHLRWAYEQAVVLAQEGREPAGGTDRSKREPPGHRREQVARRV